MNRPRLILLVAYLALVLVGGVVYAQSVSNMVTYTQADQILPGAVHVQNLTIPRFRGTNSQYSINCTMRFENPTGASIVMKTFDFSVAVDNGQPGDPYDGQRLSEETVGGSGFNQGDFGPRVDPGKYWEQTFRIAVPPGDAYRLNHTDVSGRYHVLLFDMQLTYTFPGSGLVRQVTPLWMWQVVVPDG